MWVFFSCLWLAELLKSASQCFSSNLGSFQAYFSASISFFSLGLYYTYIKSFNITLYVSEVLFLSDFFLCYSNWVNSIHVLIICHFLSDVKFSREYLISVIVRFHSRILLYSLHFLAQILIYSLIKTLFFLGL